MSVLSTPLAFHVAVQDIYCSVQHRYSTADSFSALWDEFCDSEHDGHVGSIEIVSGYLWNIPKVQ